MGVAWESRLWWRLVLFHTVPGDTAATATVPILRFWHLDTIYQKQERFVEPNIVKPLLYVRG